MLPSVKPLVATGPYTLKRTGWRISASFSIFWFSFRASGNQSELCKTLLSTCLITVYDLKPTGISPRWDWTWSCDFELNFENCPRTPIFPKLVSQGNGVGLRLYTDYMISKNGCDWFIWVFTCFALKMEFFWKSDNGRRTLSKMVVKADYFANLSWIALYDWMKICEWLLSSEYDVYHKGDVFSSLLGLWEVVCWTMWRSWYWWMHIC